MIRVIFEGQVVWQSKDKAYRKKQLKIDIQRMGVPGQTIHHDLEIPMIRDLDIILDFGRRPQTDLEMVEEDKRQHLMDLEALASMDRERLEKMRINVTNPRHPDYVAPENLSPEQVKKIDEVLAAAFAEESDSLSDVEVADEEAKVNLGETSGEEVGSEDAVTGADSGTGDFSDPSSVDVDPTGGLEKSEDKKVDPNDPSGFSL